MNWNQKIFAYRLEIISGLLLLIGLILALFYPFTGGALVGLGFGLYFFPEMRGYLLRLRELYVAQGVFKTLMLIGIIVFFLLEILFFIIGVAIGYAIRLLLSWVRKK